mgnify:CR=1 FL=1
MEFKKKLKQRLAIALSYILLGLALVIADILKGFDNYFFFSFGFALVIMGILRLFRYRRITKNDQSLRKQELIESDERIRMMAERARSWCFSLTVMLSGIAVLILSLMGEHTLAQPIAWFVCGMVLLYWICFAFLSKKY